MSRRGQSRQAQAFEALLAPDDEDDASWGRAGRKASNAQSKAAKAKSRAGSAVPGFKLREGQRSEAALATGQSAAGAAPSPGVQELLELFGGELPADVIADVFRDCGGSLQAAADFLSDMGGGATAGDASISAAAATAPAPAAHAGPCYWDFLPEECKHQVLSCLSLRDQARAARTDRSFARFVRAQRARACDVTVPPAISMRAVRGVVAAFAAAPGVDLSRWGRTLRFPHEFEDLFAAVAAGARDRSSGVPVESINLCNCVGITDGDVATMCSILRTLRRVNLAHCSGVGDAALRTLGSYRRELSSLEDEEAEQQQQQQQAAAAQLQALSLADEPAPATAASPSRFTLESPNQAVQRIAAQAQAAATRPAPSAAAAGTSPHGASHARPPASAGGIEELQLTGTGVTSKGVAANLLSASQAATHRGCTAPRAPSLRILNVSSCAGLRDGVALVPGPRSTLSTLVANWCQGLRTLCLQLPPDVLVMVASFVSCGRLEEATITAPALLDLNLSECRALRVLSVRCPRLDRLRLAGCRSLATATLDCPKLRTFSLFGCRRVEAEAVEAFAAAMPQLQGMNLTGCVGLARLVPPPGALPLLQTLKVDGCGQLRQVTLGSPELESVTAKGCTSLVEVRLPFSTPRVLDFENCAALRDVVVVGPGGGERPGAEMGDIEAGRALERAAPAGVIPCKLVEVERRLVLRGCSALPDNTRRRLKAAVGRT